MKKKGFTLIELLAVIVILAVIALIVTPIVTGIISTAKDSANARSVEGHIANVNYAIVTEAFTDASGDMNKFDGTTSALGLTMPANDNVTCASYTIKDGIVITATECTSSGWSKTYSYSNTAGAK